jgi:hypothetical protein
MQWKEPQNTDKYFWTKHVMLKMRYYGLSEQKIRSIIRSPFRKEEGIVKNTIAVMQPTSHQQVSVSPGEPASNTTSKKKAWKSEIWVMFQLKNNKPTKKIFQQVGINLLNNQKQFKIISAWRFPGVSPERNPIPEEILAEIKKVIKLIQ